MQADRGGEEAPDARLRGVSAGYAGFQALFDVSLEVKAGETVAVIGPNGAGKTTLLRVISRLIEPTAGEMTMQGRRLNDVPAHAVIGAGIAHVPENRRLFPRLTVEDNLRMGALLAGRAREVRRAAGAGLPAVSRACRSAAASRPARCPAASSRCARSAAR